MLVLPLSASVGGAPVLLSPGAVAPGTLIHENPAGSGSSDLLQNLLIVNPNPQQITLLAQVTGSGVPDHLIRVDVPPNREGVNAFQARVPFVLGPGYSFYIHAMLRASEQPLYLYGYTERYPVSFGGYGGLTRETLGPALGTLTTTATKIQGSLYEKPTASAPLNVMQDLVNGNLRLLEPGLWGLTAQLGGFNSPITANDSNAVILEVWNETVGASTGWMGTSPIPRYGEEFDVLLWSQVEITEERVGDALALYVRSRDSSPAIDISGVYNLELSAFKIDPN